MLCSGVLERSRACMFQSTASVAKVVRAMLHRCVPRCCHHLVLQIIKGHLCSAAGVDRNNLQTKRRFFQTWWETAHRLACNRKVVKYMMSTAGVVGLLKAVLEEWKSYTYNSRLARAALSAQNVRAVLRELEDDKARLLCENDGVEQQVIGLNREIERLRAQMRSTDGRLEECE